MSRICQVTGKRPITGNNVSHANNRTRRRFLPNLHTHRLWVEGEQRFVKLRVSSQGMRVIDKKGIDVVLSELRGGGEKCEGVITMRDKIKLVSSSGTGHFYTTTKNKRTTLEKLEIKKFDPVVRKHVLYKEAKIK